MRDIIETALATGMRRTEILSLQWREVEGLSVGLDGAVLWRPRPELALAAGKTKTRTARRIPISVHLKPILARRRFDPIGSPMPVNAYVFGNAFGERILNGTFSLRWELLVLKAHGFKRVLKNGNIAPEYRTELKRINLHFHDLRREAGSRWLESGVRLHTVRDWLGHTSIAQTSTYLASSTQTHHDSMRVFDEACGYLATDRNSLGAVGHVPDANTCEELVFRE